MKKKIVVFSLLVISFLSLIGCNKLFTPNTPSKETEDKEDIKPPLQGDKDTKEDTLNQNTNNNKSNTEDNKKITNKLCRVYAFNREELQLYYFDEEITVEDNALVTALTKSLKNNMPSDSFLSLSDKAEVTSAKLDEENGVLTVVFSENFLQNMALGINTESGLMASLINTYAYNYNVDKVAIYFGDTLYTSLKGTLDEGYFKAHFDDAKKYTK
ncbi:GerMN domain-containing protein [Clostridium sp.]|uniref:GerMN domain-containing protein n=1 Tax=Clostridium sp. TaxID=1506 RepID=UPI00260B5217|nr:GerMN domain-containing protein [Clostridium sp.]